MPIISSVISALIATYAVSRLTRRAFVSLPQPTRIVAAHVVSLALLMLFVGWTKSYFVTFPVSQTVVLIGPQMFWFGMDWLRDRTLA